jgi:REP element-mobilizing transposase RayT
MRALAPEVRFYNLPMSIPTRSVGTGTYFVTTATFNRRRLFQVTANAELFLETLQQYRREGHYKLLSFVVMPDHVHLLLTPQSLSIERVVGFIKGGFSHRLGSRFPFGNVDLLTTAFGIATNSMRDVNISTKIRCERGWLNRRNSIATLLLTHRRQKNVPQRLKPSSRYSSYGTAEAVPFVEEFGASR